MRKNLVLLSLIICLLINSGCALTEESSQNVLNDKQLKVIYSSDIPDYQGIPVIEINQNKAQFNSDEITSNSFENYSDLDSLGRVGVATSCLGLDTLPTKERETINDIYPSGWQQKSYDFIDGEKLYNRSHLIAYSLSAENDNKENLMTGTRYFNNELMKPYENKVREYIYQTGNHVMYRVTPKFRANNLIADGVQMEAYSVEDDGEGINYNVFCFNIQPGVIINYVDGSSQIDPNSDQAQSELTQVNEVKEYVLNTRSMKIHLPECESINSISENNKKTVSDSLTNLLNQGYVPCKNCNP